MKRQEPAADRRRGFVLAFVVRMLFAISVAGATGYLIVRSEFTMAKYSAQSAEALAVARAGLHRFVAEQFGVLGDTELYAIGNGIVTVTSRKLMEQDSITHLYYIRSEAQVSDVFSTEIPATRVVAAYAIHHVRPLAHHGAIMIAANEINLGGGGTDAQGVDSSSVGDCAGGGSSPITGGITLNDVKGGNVTGNPPEEAWGTFQAMYDSVGLRWDVLSDSNFVVDFHTTTPPNFAALPADSYPVTRYPGSNSFTSAWNGRGVLIVTGTFHATSSFRWEGIILAGGVSSAAGNVDGEVRGMLVMGLNGNNTTDDIGWRLDTYLLSHATCTRRTSRSPIWSSWRTPSSKRISALAGRDLSPESSASIATKPSHA